MTIRKIAAAARALTFVTAAALLSTTAALATGPHETLIVNTGEADLLFLYVSSVDDDSWGPDLLTNGLLEPGWYYAADPAAFGDGCEFDVKAIDTDGWETVLSAMNLCEIAEIRLTYEGAEIEYDDGYVDVLYMLGEEEEDEGYQLYEAYLNPELRGASAGDRSDIRRQ